MVQMISSCMSASQGTMGVALGFGVILRYSGSQVTCHLSPRVSNLAT